MKDLENRKCNNLDMCWGSKVIENIKTFCFKCQMYEDLCQKKKKYFRAKFMI